MYKILKWFVTISLILYCIIHGYVCWQFYPYFEVNTHNLLMFQLNTNNQWIVSLSQKYVTSSIIRYTQVSHITCLMFYYIIVDLPYNLKRKLNIYLFSVLKNVRHNKFVFSNVGFNIIINLSIIKHKRQEHYLSFLF